MKVFDSLPAEWRDKYEKSSLETMGRLVSLVQREHGYKEDRLYEELLGKPTKVKDFATRYRSISRIKDILNTFRQVAIGKYGPRSAVVRQYNKIMADLQDSFDLDRSIRELTRAAKE